MKKSLLIVFLLLGFVFSTGVVNAENGNLPKPGERREFKDRILENKDEFKTQRGAFRAEMDAKHKAFVEGMKTNRDAFKTELKAKKEEFKALKSEKKLEFCNKAKEMLKMRFEGAVKNLETIQAKIDAMVVKLEADGKDTTEVEKYLAISKTKLADAKTKLAEIKTLVPATCAEVTPDTFEKIKVLAREAKDLLKESRENLHLSVKEIKILRGEDPEDESGDDSKTTQ